MKFRLHVGIELPFDRGKVCLADAGRKSYDFEYRQRLSNVYNASPLTFLTVLTVTRAGGHHVDFGSRSGNLVGSSSIDTGDRPGSHFSGGLDDLVDETDGNVAVPGRNSVARALGDGAT
jgi:hypothetical protein